jgi:hypothetical protein
MGGFFASGDFSNVRIAWNPELPHYDSTTCMLERENMGLLGGAVAGIVIGIMFFVGCIVMVMCCCKKKKEEAPPQDFTPEQPAAPQPAQ